MNARIIGGITASIMLLASVAFAGGPLILFDADDAYHYPAINVDVYTDLGPNGMLTNAESDGHTVYGFGQWTGVSSSYFSASVTGDFSLVGLPDITGANAGLVVGTFNGGGIHVMYDDDGTITSNFFGAPPGVLGIASPDFATTGTNELLESWAMLNGTAVQPGDVGGSTFAGVFTHEFGHSINLAHTQTNGAAGFFGDGVGPDLCSVPFGQAQTITDFETMYPFLDTTPGSTGEYQKTIDHLDDVAAVSDVYPTGGWPNNTGTISGIVTDPTGLLELTGINVIARNLADPYKGANSTLTGAFTQGDFGADGRFTLNGLTPGAEYVLYIDEIVAGGFSTPPASIPGDGNEEYWNAAESSDPGVDDPCEWTLIVPVAGVPSTNDIIVNGDPFNLNLGDDDFIEVPLPFTFTFCAVPYNSVFVGSNGFVTFGEGDTDFSESVAELLNGPARICGVWDDLNPSQGGSITAQPDGADFVISYNNVPEFFATGGSSFTITLRPDNTFDVDYGVLTMTDGIAGRSPGNGEADPGPTDLSVEPQPIGALAPTVYEQYFGGNDLSGLGLAYAPCVYPDPAEIVVDPTSLSATLFPDETATMSLMISNLGDLDLDFSIKSSQGTGTPAQSAIPRLDLGPAGDDTVSDPVRLARMAEDRAGSSNVKPNVSPLKVHLPHVFALNLLSEDFNSGFPAGWSVVDNMANGVTWEVPQQGEPNITGGSGDAAGASSDFIGPADYDTELRSPVITGFGENTVISYVCNFQNFAGFDYLDLDISTDGGANWTTVLSWNEDHGSFSGPGEQVALNLDPFLAGAAEFMVRWRWYDPRGTGSAWNWFAQVDDVMIVSDEVLIPCDFVSSVVPDIGTIPGHDMTNVDVTFDATGFAPGNYDCELIISNNSFNEPRYVVPLLMRVAQEVALDIKPQHCPNTLRRFHDAGDDDDEGEGAMWGDNGAVKAVVAGGPGVDVSMIDLSTVRLAGVAPVSITLQDKYMDDCSGHRGGTQCMYEGVDYTGSCANMCQKKDGTSDLLMTFVNNDLVMALGGADPNVLFEGMLTGEFMDGTLLEGSDCLMVIETGGGGGNGGGPAETSGPSAVALGTNVPNPFNPTTTINFSLVTDAHVNITVFDVKGRVVTSLVNETRGAGDHSVTWNADNLASGIYFYRMTTGNFTQTRRMVLLK